MHIWPNLCAPLMHPSAGFPAAAPVTATFCTPPVDPKVTVASETAESAGRHARDHLPHHLWLEEIRAAA